MSPGRETSEYQKALRAEIAGGIVLAFGLTLAIVGALHGLIIAGSVGVLLSAVGAYLVAHTASAYAHGRSNVKAAQARPPQHSAPRAI